MATDVKVPGAASVAKITPIREKADQLLNQAIVDGKIQGDPDAAKRALGVPIFSEGTVTLDERTGKPIVPATEVPSFTAGSTTPPPAVTPVPAGGQTAGQSAGQNQGEKTPARAAAP